MNQYDIKDADRMFLYAWSEKTNPNETKFGERWVFSGQDANKEVYKRIKESLGVRKDLFNDGTVVLNEIWDATEYTKLNCPNRFKLHGRTDDFIREKIGYRKGNTGEVHSLSSEQMISLVNGILYGVNRPWTFKPREEQLTAITKATTYFLSGGTSFLLNGKMRFGKTLAAYWMMKQLKCETVLVLTYKPQVEKEWRESLEKHSDFEGYKFLHALDFDEKNPIEIKKGDKVVVFASFQDILGKKFNGKMKNKWKFMFKYTFDFLIIDEAHYGASTPKAMDIINKLNFKYQLLCSGTPLALLMSGEYTEKNTFTWSYVDEQKKRRIEELSGWKTEIYKSLPVLNMVLFGMGGTAIKDAYYYDENEMFSLNKFFFAEDGKFKNPVAVSLWLDLLCSKDERIYASPFNNNQMAGKLDVMFWYLDSVNAVKAMASMLSNHIFFGQYVTVVAAGDNNKMGKDTLNLVRKAIRNHKKVIILSCGKLNTGVTIPELTCVFMLNDCASPEDYWQTVFRAQSPWIEMVGNKIVYKKSDCFVVDFNPNRALKFVYDYADTICKENQKIKEVLRDVLDTMKILSYQDNTLTQITSENFGKIIEAAINPKQSVNIFESQLLINPLKINDSIMNMLKNVDATKSKTFNFEITSSVLGKGKMFKSVGKLSKKQKSELNNIRARAITIMKRIPTFQYISSENIECIKSLLKTKLTDEFKNIVGLSIEDFTEMVDSGYVDYKRLNNALQAFDYERGNI